MDSNEEITAGEYLGRMAKTYPGMCWENKQLTAMAEQQLEENMKQEHKLLTEALQDVKNEKDMMTLLVTMMSESAALRVVATALQAKLFTLGSPTVA